jgi:hypothetical protein
VDEIGVQNPTFWDCDSSPRELFDRLSRILMKLLFTRPVWLCSLAVELPKQHTLLLGNTFSRKRYSRASALRSSQKLSCQRTEKEVSRHSMKSCLSALYVLDAQAFLLFASFTCIERLRPCFAHLIVALVALVPVPGENVALPTGTTTAITITPAALPYDFPLP